MKSLGARDIGRYLALSAAVVGVYYLLARLGLLMVLPPYQVAPIYPAAGWGLAVLLVWGLRYTPAVALGSFIVQLTMMSDQGGVLGLAAGIGLGAAMQAVAGTLLMRRPPVISSGSVLNCQVTAGSASVLMKPAGMWMKGLRSGGPASSTQTVTEGSALSRLASTEPAAPEPTMT